MYDHRHTIIHINISHLRIDAIGRYGCDDSTEGRLRCAHMQLVGPPTRAERTESNRTVDGYWFARSIMGLWKDEKRWNQLVEAGKHYVAHTRSLKSWGETLGPLFK